jgi:hypothetical protein
MNEEVLADLYYIGEYAAACRRLIEKGRNPHQGFLNRMRDLAEKVQRQYDSQYEEWCNGEARR